MILTAAAGVFAAAQIDGDGRRQSGPQRQRRRYRGAFRADRRLVARAKHYGQGGEQNAKFFARVQEKPVLG